MAEDWVKNAEAVSAKDSSEADLKNVEKQAEEQYKQLHYIEINLATEKQLDRKSVV